MYQNVHGTYTCVTKTYARVRVA